MTSSSPTNQNCNAPANSSVNTSGWQYCAGALPTPQPNNASIGWKLHQGVITYYANNTTIPQTGTNPISQPKGVLRAKIGVPQAFGSTWGCSYTQDIVFEKTFETTLNNNNDPGDLGNFASIQSGDYVFINSGQLGGGSDHGFLSIGWGPMISCSDARGRVFSNNAAVSNSVTLIPLKPTANSQVPTNWQFAKDIWAAKNLDELNFYRYTAPYFVDFAGPAPSSARTQRPIPRPFYCSTNGDPGGSTRDANGQVQAGYFYRGHSWWFVEIPNAVAVNTTQLYAPVFP